jgi:hypothetical protein
MIADKSHRHRNRAADSDRRQRLFGSRRMNLLRLGLPLSRRRAAKAHCGDEGSPALSRPQHPAPRLICKSRDLIHRSMQGTARNALTYHGLVGSVSASVGVVCDPSATYLSVIKDIMFLGH